MNHEKTDPPVPDEGLLDSSHLGILEKSFRDWAANPRHRKSQASRVRVLLMFLLIRYTGSKLMEVLGLNPSKDIDTERRTIAFRGQGLSAKDRVVEISESLAREIETLLPMLKDAPGHLFALDPSFVRRRFYERAEECGIDPSKAGPEMIRKARALELMQNNLPMPAVQRLLGGFAPNPALQSVFFSDEEMGEITRRYMERESGVKTSARNSFFGKVRKLVKGDVQTFVETSTPDGGLIYTVITNTSADRMGLKVGRLVTAEVKAPWLTLERCDRAGTSSADNVREGVIARVTRGKVNTECAVCVADGTELCAVLSTHGFQRLGLKEGDPVRVLFSSYAVILQTE